MARIYATEGDVQEYADDTSLTVSDLTLRRASLVVDRLTRNARYRTDEAGLPTDAAVADALRDATSATVLWFDATGSEDGTAGQLASMGLGSASFSFQRSGDPVADARATQTATDAVDILRTAGLMNPGVCER